MADAPTICGHGEGGAGVGGGGDAIGTPAAVIAHGRHQLNVYGGGKRGRMMGVRNFDLMRQGPTEGPELSDL
jgi:hypothetical protein